MRGHRWISRSTCRPSATRPAIDELWEWPTTTTGSAAPSSVLSAGRARSAYVAAGSSSGSSGASVQCPIAPSRHSRAAQQEGSCQAPCSKHNVATLCGLTGSGPPVCLRAKTC